MAQWRSGRRDVELLRGPGNLGQALDLDLGWDGHDLTRGRRLWLADAAPVRRIGWSARIGLGDHPSAHWSWRCFERDNPCVSRHPSAGRPRSRPRPSLLAAEAMELRRRS